MATAPLRASHARWPRGSTPLALIVAASIALLFAFAPAWRHKTAIAGALPLDAPLPTTVPPGVVLRVGDPINKWIFQHNGWDKKLPFRIEWSEIGGGPDTTEALHAGALDVGSGANVPPIHADWSGIPVRIVAYRRLADAATQPSWVIGVSPQSHIRSIADLKGKRIAFSPSQVQALVVLETLKAAGIRQSEVTLVELPSNIGGDVYTSALASGAIDAAPLASGLVAQRYLARFSEDGARVLKHPPFRDDGLFAYVPETTLQDPGKAAALRLYAQYWGYAQAWSNAHPEELARGYYGQARGLKFADAMIQVRALGPVSVPRDWQDGIAFQQSAIDILAPATRRPVFAADKLFDRRFQTIAADAALRGNP